ncbi:MAG: HD domain-containing protein [Desulfomonilaceae bacterium]|nr:HD domain-containing protein [Desulfomonilaceae bacterium]
MQSDQNLFEQAVSIKDLKPGDTVLHYFEVKSKEARKTRSGQDYLDLLLADATGSIPTKIWSDTIRKWGSEYVPGDIVKVEGRVDSYRDRNQIVVDKIRKADISEVPDPSRVVKTTRHDTDALMNELREYARKLEPPGLAELVEDMLVGNEDRLKTYPAAKMIHHAYQGGLIEHIVTVTRKVAAILPLEPSVNRSIAIAGAILHDIGKIHELRPEAAGRTLEGRLIGHVILGVEAVRRSAVERGVDEEPWLYELEHVLLSHHGEPQFGAPVRPLTREALVVHFIDNLDSKLKIMEEALESADSDGFTQYNKWLEGRAYMGSPSQEQE